MARHWPVEPDMQTPMGGQKWAICMRGVLKMEARCGPALAGRTRHADPNGRTEVGDLHERGAENGGAVWPGTGR